MIKKINKFGKRVVIDIKEGKNYFAGGYILSKRHYLRFFFILVGSYLILSTFLIFLKSQDWLLLIVVIYSVSFILSFKHIKALYKFKFPDYYISIKGNKKIGKDFILEHELLHLKIMEKLCKNKELEDFFNNSLDKLTTEQLSSI